jgi:predicted RNA-binding protein YlxR (DUF448 family)
MTRTCVGCHAAVAESELVRLVLGPDASLVVTMRGGSIGRGVWLHPTAECVKRGVPRGASRSLKTEVKSSMEDVLAQLRNAGTRRALSLVGAAFRAKKAAPGATAASEALEHGVAGWVVVARDARAAAELPAVLGAIGRGRGIALATKAELGAALGRADTAVVAILDEGIGESLRQAALLSDLASPRDERGVMTGS